MGPAVAQIDEALRSFLEPNLVISLGTCAADLTPSGVRAWGPSVSEDGSSVQLFIDRPSAAPAIANLRDNGRVAACFTDVTSLRSVQLKGRCVELGDPQPEDWLQIERHRDAFAKSCEVIGYPKHVARNIWSMQVVKVRFIVDQVFNQTPGPGAGGSL
jgi:Pyridoxamine 5'-phosphate oxidase